MSRTSTILFTLIPAVIAAAGMFALGYMVSSHRPASSNTALKEVQTDVSQMAIRIGQLRYAVEELVKAQQKGAMRATENPAPTTEEIDKLIFTVASLDKRLSVLEESEDAKAHAANERANRVRELERQLNDDEQVQMGIDKYARYFSDLDASIQSVDPDPAFATRIDTRFGELVASRPEWIDATHIGATQCNATLCRFEVVLGPSIGHNEKFELEHILIQGVASELPLGKMKTEPLPDGSVRLIGYMARRDQSLPPMSKD
jgi:hypothetical protein